MYDTLHSRERLTGRLADLPADVRLDIERRAARYAASHPYDRHAVRCFRSGHMHGVAWSDESNGTDVWAIIDNGAVRTYMYRRPTQPATPDALRVRYIAIEE